MRLMYMQARHRAQYCLTMTYEYECKQCSHRWEQEAPISAEPEKKCPKCGQESAQRLVSPSTFVLKGGGWAADGYKGS